MEHEQYLLELLRPLGVYDLSANSVNRGELGAYGKELDGCFHLLEDTAREMNLTTAEGMGLDRVEELLSHVPAAANTEARRTALAALLRIGGDSFTLAAINDAIAGCGVNAQVAEGNAPGYVTVSFPGLLGKPADMERVEAIISHILPCHLETEYTFRFRTWSELAIRMLTWGRAEAKNTTWDGMSAWP